MGSGVGQHLHSVGDTPLHRLPATAKLVGLVLFVLAVVAVPGPAFPALAALLVVAGAILLSTRVPLRHLAPRLLVEVPFLVFALVLPLVALGPRTQVGPLSLSIPGLEGAWTLVAKGTIGVMCGVAFAVTTSARDFVDALQRLRVPALMVAVLTFMVRYTSVVTEELQRMRIARESRGFQAGPLRSWPVLATSLGALFVRSYERGERVHLAMLSRGHTGAFTLTSSAAPTSAQWVLALGPAVLATLALVGVHLT